MYQYITSVGMVCYIFETADKSFVQFSALNRSHSKVTPAVLFPSSLGVPNDKEPYVAHSADYTGKLECTMRVQQFEMLFLRCRSFLVTVSPVICMCTCIVSVSCLCRVCISIYRVCTCTCVYICNCSVYLPVCVSVAVSVSDCICLIVSVYICICLCICVWIWICIGTLVSRTAAIKRCIIQ